METIMRWLLILLIPSLLAPAGVYAQEYQFTREWDSVQVQIGEYTLPAGWTGGYLRSSPELADWDGDGVLDLLMGSSEKTLHCYMNQGTSIVPHFVFNSGQFQGIEIPGLYGFLNPAVCDVDNDADLDLFTGDGGAVIRFFRNSGSATQPQLVLAVDTLRDENGTWIWGEHPVWVDIDDDGDFDFFCGRYTGTIRYYDNIGSPQQYLLHLVTEQFAGVNLGYQNHADPDFCDIDADGDQDLFVGDKYGKIRYWRNDGTPQQANFVWVTNQWMGIDVGDYAAPEFADMDSDGDYDLWVGRDAYNTPPNDPGDVYYYENTGNATNPQLTLVRTSNLTLDAGLGNLPHLSFFSADSSLDLLFSNAHKLYYYQNIGTPTQPVFQMFSENLLDFPPYSVDLYDLDADGDLDLICANGTLFNPEVLFYKNVGTVQNPHFRYDFAITNLNYDAIWPVSLADVDDDGDGDMVFGTWGSGMAFYQNQGTPQSPNFVFQINNWQNFPSQLSPFFVDMERDGDFDLLAGFSTTGVVELWENIGNPQVPQFVLADSNLCGNIAAPGPTGADIDDDGDIDLLVGSYDGGIYFFRNTTGEQPVSPYTRPYLQRVMDLSLSPQPGNPTTAISFQLPFAQEVDLAVYNLLGARVATIASGKMNAGSYSLPWESSGYASGIYFVRLTTPTATLTRKLTVMK